MLILDCLYHYFRRCLWQSDQVVPLNKTEQPDWSVPLYWTSPEVLQSDSAFTCNGALQHYQYASLNWTFPWMLLSDSAFTQLCLTTKLEHTFELDCAVELCLWASVLKRGFFLQNDCHQIVHLNLITEFATCFVTEPRSTYCCKDEHIILNFLM